MWQRFLRYTQAQLSQIMILPLSRKLLQGNSFRRTHHATLSTCQTRLMIRGIRLTTRSTLSTRFFTRSTRFSTRRSRLFTRSTRLSTCSICLSTHSICLSTCSICLFTRSNCWSFYHWSCSVLIFNEIFLFA